MKITTEIDVFRLKDDSDHIIEKADAGVVTIESHPNEYTDYFVLRLGGVPRLLSCQQIKVAIGNAVNNKYFWDYKK